MTSKLHILAASFALAFTLVVPLNAAGKPLPFPKGYFSKENPLFNYTDVDEKPRPTERGDPQLTAELLNLRIQAAVTVEFIISKTGEIIFADAIRTTDARFNDVCIAAVKKWKFTPPIKNGKPVNCRAAQTITVN